MNKFLIDHNRPSRVLPTVGLYNQDSLHIVVLFGGMSAERDVSLASGEVVYKAMSEMNYKVTPIDMGVDIADILRKLNPDLVFNALHGTFGEDGCVQGMLEILGIPYTHSGVLASAIALDKVYSQQLYQNGGIKCPKRVIISREDDLSIEPIKRPYVIKPINQGSSLGVEVIFAEDDYDLSKYDFAYSDKAIIEEYIPGQEIQVAVLNNKAIGTLEIICLKKRFYDYESKYVDGFAKHLCPANLSKQASENILAIAEKAHKLIGCRGATRVEFRYNPEENQAYFLEINTHPGITPLSIVPEIAEKNGINFQNFLQILINEAINEQKKKSI